MISTTKILPILVSFNGSLKHPINPPTGTKPPPLRLIPTAALAPRLKGNVMRTTATLAIIGCSLIALAGCKQETVVPADSATTAVVVSAPMPTQTEVVGVPVPGPTSTETHTNVVTVPVPGPTVTATATATATPKP